MDIKTRKQAKLAGENTYFTGRECINGHISYRYVQSGGCYQCIRADHKSIGPAQSELRHTRLQAVAEAERMKDSLQRYKIRLFLADRDPYALTVWGHALFRFPNVDMLDIAPRVQPADSSAGTALFTFLAHPDDVAALKQIGVDMVNARCRQSSAFDAQLKAAEVAQLATERAQPFPDWADKP